MAAFPPCGGELGALIRAHDWAATPLGPIDGWPPSLKTATSILLCSPVPIVLMWGADGIMLYNDAYSVIAGGRHPQLLGSKVREGWPEVAGFNDNVMRVVMSGGTLAYRDQEFVLHRHGRPEQVWMNLDYSPVSDESGEPVGVICILAETTEGVTADRKRRAAEAQFREGAARFRALVDASSDAVFRMSPDWTELRPLDGRGFLADAEGPSVDWLEEYVLPEDRPAVSETIQKVMRTRGVFELENRVHRSDGSVGWVYSRAVPVLDDRGEIAEWFGMATDVTRRARAVEALAESEARYRTLFESIESGFCVVEVKDAKPGSRSDYRVVEANPAFFRQTGFPKEVLSRWLREAAPDLEEHWYETYTAVARTGIPHRFEQASSALGRWFDVYAFSVGEATQNRVAILFNDISDRRNAEQRLRELNETLEQQVLARTAERDRMWDTSPDLMCIIDFEGVLKRVNPAWATVLGYASEELVGRHVNEFVLPEDHDETRAAYESAAAGGLPRIENRYRHKDGSARWISWVAAPAEGMTYATGRDVTADKDRRAELETAQTHLLQAQKMEAVGQLTGGVAHDFNNLLQAMGSCLSLIARRRPERDVTDLIEAGQQAVDRGAKLVRQLMAFSRREGLRPEPLDLQDRVLAVADLLRRTLHAGIRLETTFEPGLWPVEADPTQLELALLNLAANARDAIPNHGTLTITADNVTIAPGRKSEPSGEFVRLRVADTGAGIAPEVAARAFEPFFTTKSRGSGTGLGLAQVYGFARQCGGTASVDSTPGEGTTVTLLLRRSMKSPLRSESAEITGATATPGKRVLLVEDDPLVASAVTASLEDAGFVVTCMTTADDALPLLEGDARIDVLLSDVVMPGELNGVDLAREAKRLRPGLPTLLTTGYSEDVARIEGVRVLSKPCPMDSLIQALAEATAGKSGI